MKHDGEYNLEQEECDNYLELEEQENGTTRNTTQDAERTEGTEVTKQQLW